MGVTGKYSATGTPWGRAGILFLVVPWAPCLSAEVRAQETGEDRIPGVSLGLVYETGYLPPVAIMPFTLAEGENARPQAAEVASRAGAILARDLRYSDRFVVMDSFPLLDSDGVDYDLWDGFGADWLVTGTLEGTDGGYVLAVELHDIVFSSVRQRDRFLLPGSEHSDFRMSVHTVSDAVVEWVTGDPGAAASRIVFTMRPYSDQMSKELYVVDSDGENLERITWDENTVASPAWAPDGNSIAYVSWKSGTSLIYQLDLEQNRERVLEPERGGQGGPGATGQQITPTYHPDGHRIAFALLGGGRSGLFSFDVQEGCCLSQLIGGRYKDLQPTYSSDGRYMAFTSNRMGTATPQIYVMSAGGGEARLLSPYRFGEGGYFSDPDWSPLSAKVAFSGRIRGRRTRYQILVADVQTEDSRLIQLTREGDNQDPSWAPDGRHIVFTGERSYGYGVFVVDAGTGRTRILVPNVRAEDTDWSPSLGRTGPWGGADAGASPGRR